MRRRLNLLCVVALISLFVAQKTFNDKKLVLAEKYSGDGHTITILFVISNDKKVVNIADGQTPISMCFSANVSETLSGERG